VCVCVTERERERERERAREENTSARSTGDLQSPTLRKLR
jgi:hypothetical protein